MRMVSQLYGNENSTDIYVVGTGTSLRVFPLSFFDGKTVIALNQAWKLVPAKYAITIHPDLNVPEYMLGSEKRPELTWVIGNRKAQAVLNPEQMQDAESRCFFFNYHGKPNTEREDQPSNAGRIIEWVEQSTEDNLYVWSSIAQAGANLAANLGAKNVIMVGCDNSDLGGNHHAHGQHTRWKGTDPQIRYEQYYQGLAEVRTALRKRGVNLVNLNPFLKLDSANRDFYRLCEELNLPTLVSGKDLKVKLRSRNWLQRLCGRK